MKIMTRSKLICWTIIIFTFLANIALETFLKMKHIDIPSLFFTTIWFIAISILFTKDKQKGMNQEQKEERQKNEQMKASIFCIYFISIIGLAYSIAKGAYIIKDITADIPFKTLIPSLIETQTLTLCSIFILLISINVRKRQIFTLKNTRYIDCIGYTVLLSTYIQHYYWDTTEMVPNMTVRHYFYLFALFIIFFGRLFAIAVKMREEQDLTI